MGIFDKKKKDKRILTNESAKGTDVKIQEVQTGSIQLAGSTALEEIANLTTLARKQDHLLDKLRPIPEDVARGFFRKLGVPKPNEYQNAIQAFSSFRSFGLSSEGSAVDTWYLKIDTSSEGCDALYVHIDDPVIPIGLAICKLARGSFLGYYTTGLEFKDKLRL